MAEEQKEASSRPSGKSSSIGDEIGKEFLSSWKSMSVGDDDMMDFGFGSVTKGKKETLQFGNLDMDFSLNEKFDKIGSFKVDLPDLDFSSPSKRSGRSTEKGEASASKNIEAREEPFAFSFDFNKLDSFDVDSTTEKENKKSKIRENIESDSGEDKNASEGGNKTRLIPSDSSISEKNQSSPLSTKGSEKNIMPSHTERITELKIPLKREERKSKNTSNIDADLDEHKNAAEESTKAEFLPFGSFISEKKVSLTCTPTKASEKKALSLRAERITELKFPLKKKLSTETHDRTICNLTSSVAVSEGSKQIEKFVLDPVASRKPDVSKIDHGLPDKTSHGALNESPFAAIPVKENPELTIKVPSPPDDQLKEGDAAVGQSRLGSEVTKSQLTLVKSEKKLPNAKINLPIMLSTKKFNLPSARRNVLERNDKKILDHIVGTNDGKSDTKQSERRLSAISSLKRKSPEVKCAAINQPKRLLELRREKSKPMDDLKQVIVEGNSPASNIDKNLPFDSSLSSLNMPENLTVSETSLALDNDETVAKADACAKELEDICNMLRKKHDEAKDLLVRAIVHNNNLLMLDHPMYQEKVDSVRKFAAQLASKDVLA